MEHHQRIRQEYNKKMIGKRVWIINGGYYADIIDLYNNDEYLIRTSTNRERVVSIWDVRAIEEEAIM